MIKKLRIKFIAVSMLSLLAVLIVIMGLISFFSFSKVVSDADETLSILAENNGAFPDMTDFSNNMPDSDEHKNRERSDSLELPYESRYYSVFLSSDGSIISVNTGKIAAVDTSAAIEYAQVVMANGKEQGFLGDYRYISYISDSETHIIFLDCGRSLDTFRTFVFTGIAVCLSGLLAVFLLMFFLSGRIVKPFSENYEKQKRFITDAGHELKTPLTIIDADAEVLEMDLGENEWLKDIQNQTKRLADLTNNLILLSRMEEEQTQSLMIEFPLSDVAEETLESFKTLAKAQNKTLTDNISPMISMKGDEKSIRKLITILMDNAIKYTEEGGAISLALEKQKNQIKLSVYNTTKFISKDSLQNLFDRFYRTDQSRNSQTGGYGLGLSIAAAVVNAHKGKIFADTDDEKSLLITAVFPA